MILRYAARSLLVRPGVSLVTLVGVFLCSAALTNVLAMLIGIKEALAGGGGPDLFVYASPEASEGSSNITASALSRLSTAPGLRVEGGVTQLSPEMVVSIPTRVGGVVENVRLRGLDPVGFSLEHITLLEGSLPERGSRSVLVGAGLQRRHPEYRVGGMLRLGNGQWPITGSFRADGRSLESEMLVDRAALTERLGRKPGANIAVVRLDPTQRSAASDYGRRLGNDSVELVPYKDFAAKSLTTVRSYFRIADLLVAALALGALCAGASALDASYMSRIAELAALLVIGFTRRRVALMLLTETLILTLLGGLLGLGACMVLSTRPIHVDALALVFQPRVTPLIVAVAFGTSLLTGAFASALAISQLFRLKILDSLR